LISREKLVQLYAAMVKCRMLSEWTGPLVRQGKLPHDWEIAAGSEAALAGVAANLLAEDTLSAPGKLNKQLLSSLIEGASLERIFSSLPAALNGHLHLAAAKSGSPSAGLNGRSARSPAFSSARSYFVEATQAAETHKAAKDGRIALVLCSEPIPAKALSKQLQFVSRHDLPMVVITYLNSPNRQTKGASANGFGKDSTDALVSGVPRIAVDARDALAVYRVASESVSRARQGRGPTLIECMEFSVPAAKGSRIAFGIADRTENGFADSVHAMASYLGKKRILDSTLKHKIESRILREIDAASRGLLD
jgi:acetoin:2,6-dichlorophenolindophenol oxidoreductase subunit alpha